MERAPATIFDTPHTMIGDDLRQQREDISRASAIDFNLCNVLTIVLALNGFDRARISTMSHRSETWPPDVRALVDRAFAEFSTRNGVASVAAVTTAIAGDPKAFITAIHWRPKA